MVLMSRDEYIESLKKLKPNIYKYGRIIEDVTTYPETKYTVYGVAELYRMAYDSRYRELITTKSNITGGLINRYTSIMESVEDAIVNLKLKRLAFQRTGTCTGGRCVGWSCMNSMWATTYEIDKEYGTDYHSRLRSWIKYVQEEDLAVAGALTDPKGIRGLPPSQQQDPDMYLRVVERRSNGIIVNGAKIMIAGVASCHEVFVMPTLGLRESEGDYALAFAVPRDIDGLIIVEARQPNDSRKGENGFDKAVEIGGISQAYLFFDHVFIPWDRVFMCGEYNYAGTSVARFTFYERPTMAGCVAGQGDVKVAAAALMAYTHGLSVRPFMDRFIDMVIDNETLFSCGLAAIYMGSKHSSGVWIPNPLLSNVAKWHVARIPYNTSILCQDIAGGIGETGCMPSYADFKSSKTGKYIEKYLKAASTAESRMRAARLVEWVTMGAGVPGCMHGGGSPYTARATIGSLIDFKKYVDIGRYLAGIEEDIIASCEEVLKRKSKI